MNIEIRLENEKDHREVEELAREAFWNLYVPGGNEHLIVHNMRKSEDFISELNFVALIDSKIVGHIMYSYSKVVNPSGDDFKTITIGPISVLPEFQRRGIGSALLEHSKRIATEIGFKAIVIYGYPSYYNKFGFVGASKFGISRADGQYAVALLALELHKEAFKDTNGSFFASSVFEIEEKELEIFDQTFPPKEKKVQKSQEEFALMVDALE